jgi:hypothetical protein
LNDIGGYDDYQRNTFVATPEGAIIQTAFIHSVSHILFC